MLLGALQEKHCRFGFVPGCTWRLPSTIEFQVMSVSSKQIAVRAGGFSAIVVVCMAVFGVAILYSTFYVWLGVDSPGSMKVTDCKFLVHSTPENTLDYNPTCPPIIYLFSCSCKLQYHFVM